MSDDQESASSDLLIADHGRVRVMTINRPERANALTPQLARALADAVFEADATPDVAVVVVTGAGDRHFCAGMDLKAAGERAQAKPLRSSIRASRRSVYEVFLESWKPTIAAIEGAAIGGGLELALTCDLRFASRTAKLGLPEARRGLSARFGTVLLPRLAPPAVAFELLYTGQPITGERAAAVGLINRATEPGQALSQALEMARDIAQNAPITLRRMKETAIKASGLPIAAALRLNEGVDPLGTADAVEGMRAFNENRPPNWSGR